MGAGVVLILAFFIFVCGFLAGGATMWQPHPKTRSGDGRGSVRGVAGEEAHR
jgi:hypothetical protein